MAKYFIAFLILGCLFVSADASKRRHHRSSSEECCRRRSPCEKMNARQAIISLWKLPETLTPLTRKFKHCILAELTDCDDSQVPYLMSLTLWAVDMNTGFCCEKAPSSVYQNLIKATIEKKNDKCDCKYDRAVSDYGNLCHSAIEFSVQVGLRAAGCPWKPLNHTAPPTTIEPHFNQYLDDSDNIPCCIKDAIIKLSKSCHEVDRTIAAGAIASSTDSSIKLFNYMMSTDVLLDAVRLKACKIRIPRKCCKYRAVELRKRAAAVDDVTKKHVSDMINE